MLDHLQYYNYIHLLFHDIIGRDYTTPLEKERNQHVKYQRFEVFVQRTKREAQQVTQTAVRIEGSKTILVNTP